MTWRTHPVVVGLRNVARSLGLTGLAGRVFRSPSYEAKFQDAMMNLIRPGDVVWDIGANVGLYTDLFCDRVGPGGAVFAVEPGPANLEVLRRNFAARSTAVILGLALGDCEGDAVFAAGSDALGATGRVIASASTEGGSIRVPMTTGDRLIASGVAKPPNVAKVDTEGFELEVLSGMRDALKNPLLRALCIEIHFGLLDLRGLRNAPARIESLLKGAGFRISWPDSSHIIAARESA